jgi:uronate dehydrogenase
MMPVLGRLLLTGAAGRVGTLIRPGLAEIAHEVRLVDLRSSGALMPHEVELVGDLAQIAADAVQGCDGILHLAAVSTETDFASILTANIIATEALYRAAATAGVRRIVFASSNHVTGFYPVTAEVGPSDPVRPDSLYAASKVWGEALARYYFDAAGIESAVVRLGSVFEKPETVRHLSTWMSARDLVSLIGHVFGAERFGFSVMYGVSGNGQSWWRREGLPPGWQAADRAEDFPGPLRGKPGQWQGGDLPERARDAGKT